METAGLSSGELVEVADEVVARVDPDEARTAFLSLLGDPGGVGFVVLVAALDVAVLIDVPSDVRHAAFFGADDVHLHGGGADKVGPPAVVAVSFDAIVFPFSESWAASEDDVLVRKAR